MKFSDFILSDAIITDVQSSTKDGVIDELVQALAAAGGIPESDVEEVAHAIKRREELGPTGIGRGLAIPHTKHACVERFVAAVAICQGDGVDFDALDGAPVKVFFLLVSPPDAPGDHLKALGFIMQRLKDAAFVKSLMQSTTREEVVKAFMDADKNELDSSQS